jgi:hypothetical protein
MFCAINFSYRIKPLRTISSYIAPKGLLLRVGDDPAEDGAARQACYADFPPFRGIAYP